MSSCAWETAPEDALTGNGTSFPNLTIGVVEARGIKCPRCWMHSDSQNEDGLCARCAAVISELDIEL